MRVASSDGVEVAVHDLGGDGPVLVLAHATGFHGRAWGPLTTALAAHFHCWSFDARGHGDSTRPRAGNFDWEGFGDDALAVVDGLGLGSPFGFGHSQGGSALLLAEQARAGAFRGLYLYEPVAWPAPFAMDDHPLVVGALRRRDHFASVPAALDRLGSKPPLGDLDPGALRAYVEGGVVAGPGGQVRLKCRREDEAQTYRMGPRHRAFDHLGEVGCPVTLARGSRSASVSPELAERQVAALARGHLEVFEGLGHFGPLEDPARVAASVVDALLAP
ncbi:MAG: alpha/beta hydrolase [Actinomycetota bacterium]|nr:alpha/beta hydrolase [Actinomycetota bacterium]